MKSKTLRRKSVTIANSRWATYAVAGAATSLASLATAEAEIHYSGSVNFRFTGTLHAQFPLDNGASLDFFRIDEGGGQGYAHINIPNSIGDFAGTAIGSEGSYLYVSRLSPRVQVSQLTLRNSCDSTSSSGVRCFGAIIGLEGGGPVISKSREEDSSVSSSTPGPGTNSVGRGSRRPGRRRMNSSCSIMPGPIPENRFRPARKGAREAAKRCRNPARWVYSPRARQA